MMNVDWFITLVLNADIIFLSIWWRVREEKTSSNNFYWTSKSLVLITELLIMVVLQGRTADAGEIL